MRADYRAVLVRERAAARIRFERLSQTKVQHLDPTVGSHLDVRGFQIPMNDALLVRSLDSRFDLKSYANVVFDCIAPRARRGIVSVLRFGEASS